MSSGFWLVSGIFLIVGALSGGLLWLDARSRRWSNRPLYQFVVAGAVLLTPILLVLVKVVAGGFNNASQF
jgi:hypothetical protein